MMVNKITNGMHHNKEDWGVIQMKTMKKTELMNAHKV